MTGLDRYLHDLAFANTGFLVLDFEGVSAAGCSPEPIEVGAVLIDARAGQFVSVNLYEALIRPPGHTQLGAAETRLTGITVRMLADQRSAAIVLAELDTLLTSPPYVTVAHHAPTEAAILRRYAHACPILAACPTIDTLRLAKAAYPGLGSYALDALLAHLGMHVPAARHRALPDAQVTAELFQRLLADGSVRHGWSQLAQLRHLAGLPLPADPQNTLF